jgi:hypothetical protein
MQIIESIHMCRQNSYTFFLMMHDIRDREVILHPYCVIENFAFEDFLV